VAGGGGALVADARREGGHDGQAASVFVVLGRLVVPVKRGCAIFTAALIRALGAEETDIFGGASALVLLRHLSPPEKDRLAIAVRSTGRVDAGTVEVIEKLTAQCRRLDDDFGPSTVLPVVDRQRAVVADILRRETMLPGLRIRLTHAGENGPYAEG